MSGAVNVEVASAIVVAGQIVLPGQAWLCSTAHRWAAKDGPPRVRQGTMPACGKPSWSMRMRDISDIWYLVKLAIKTAIFLVIFGGGGWLLYTYPSQVSQPPKTEEEFRARVEVFVQTYPSELTNDDERRQDIRHPFVKDDENLRLIWGPWEPAEERATWTAYDAAYVEQFGKNIHEAVANLSAMRERSRRYCDGLEGVWLALEREDYKRTTTVDESIRLWQIRKQQSECRYWQRQAKQIETQ